MLRFRLLVAALSLTVTTFPFSVSAQQDALAQDPVVARVDGEAVMRSEVLALASELPAQYQAQIKQLYPLLVNRLIDFKLAGRAGRAAGLAGDEKVKARMAAFEDRAIRDLYIERAIDAEVTEEKLQARYQGVLDSRTPETELRARHILLKTEEEAREIIVKLDGGENFAALAKEHSTGPSATKGGDLGYFAKGQMVPEFDDAASALDPGQYTKDPVKTQFGWHVIKVEDRRETASPTFQELEPRLRSELAREVVEVLLVELRDAAEIEILPAGTSFTGNTGEAKPQEQSAAP